MKVDMLLVSIAEENFLSAIWWNVCFVNGGYVKAALHIGARAYRLVMCASAIKARCRYDSYRKMSRRKL